MTASQAQPERSFPRLHPRPARGWLNDPNGIHRWGGRWHVFFQFNPSSARHEHIAWGHHSSTDLLVWREHPVALTPQPDGPDAYGCWSGIGTIDEGVPTLVYSGVLAGDGRSQVVLARRGEDEDQWLQDGTIATGMPEADDVTVVRDPALFELGDRRWAIQGAGRADGSPAILLYDAADLTDWRYHGLLLGAEDPVAAKLPPANVWECPQLMRVGDDWVLIVSLWLDQQLTGVGYLIGELTLDPASGLPRFVPRDHGRIDEGPSFYAPQAVQDAESGRVLVWGWAREATAEGVRGRTQEDNDAVGWSGALTFPRQLVVEEGRARLVPAAELGALTRTPADPGRLPDQVELVLSGHGPARLLLGTPGNEAQPLWSGTLDEDGPVRILIDASVIEVFPPAGSSQTLRAYPEPGERYLIEAAPGVSVEAWGLALPS